MNSVLTSCNSCMLAAVKRRNNPQTLRVFTDPTAVVSNPPLSPALTPFRSFSLSTLSLSPCFYLHLSPTRSTTRRLLCFHAFCLTEAALRSFDLFVPSLSLLSSPESAAEISSGALINRQAFLLREN